MKKYWKINYNADLKKSLEYLKLPPDYIKVLLDDDSDMMISIKKYNQVFICKEEEIKDRIFVKPAFDGGFGWCDIIDEDWLKQRDYTYLGEVNLRKQKLENINEKILENKL